MTIEELQNFLILANLLHFGKASQACNLSPSALTRSIQRMEDSIGAPLFFRDKRSVSLTSTGVKFRDYAHQTVRDWQIFLKEVKDNDNWEDSISIYSSVTAVYSILPELLESYRTTYPHITLDLHTGSAEESIQQVLNDQIDIAIAALPDTPLKGIEFQPLIETKLVFVGQSGCSPFFHPPIDLTSTPLVFPRSGLSRRRLDLWFRQNNITPHIASEVSGNEGILAMVRLGCGIGIVPELVLERSPFRSELHKIESTPQLKPYIVGLCCSTKNLKRPSIQALWEMAKKQNW